MIIINHYENGVSTYKFKTKKEAERFYSMTKKLKCDSTLKGKFVHVSN